jgi:hypothetical protein
LHYAKRARGTLRPVARLPVHTAQTLARLIWQKINPLRVPQQASKRRSCLVSSLRMQTSSLNKSDEGLFFCLMKLLRILTHCGEWHFLSILDPQAGKSG